MPLKVGIGAIFQKNRGLSPDYLLPTPMKMGGKTLMGFIFVDASGYRTETQLKAWIQQSLDVISAAQDQKKVGTPLKQ